MSDDERLIQWLGLAFMGVIAGLEAWLIADHLTGGQFKEKVGTWWRNAAGPILRRRQIDETVAAQAGAVVWEAMQALDDEGNRP